VDDLGSCRTTSEVERIPLQLGKPKAITVRREREWCGKLLGIKMPFALT
jgi:hypothetical protein